MEKKSKRELIKICIEKTAEIVRFLLEINKRPKILEELPEEELKEYQNKFAFLSMDFYHLLMTPRQEFEIKLEQQRSNKKER